MNKVCIIALQIIFQLFPEYRPAADKQAGMFRACLSTPSWGLDGCWSCYR